MDEDVIYKAKQVIDDILYITIATGQYVDTRIEIDLLRI